MNRDVFYAVIGGFLMVFGATYAKAADLGKPAAAPAAVAAEPVKDQWVGPFVQFGGGADFVKSGDKAATGVFGIGYSHRQFGSSIVVSVLARYGFSAEGNSDSAILTFDVPITLAARIGYLAQPSTQIYGIAGFSKSINNDFQGPMVGIGAETPVFGSLRLGLEYTAQFDRSFKADKDVINQVRALATIPF